MTTETLILPDEAIINKIYIMRGKKVIVDRDLAGLYGVETRGLNQAVRRNEKRFPEDFMFQMTLEEMRYWKSQIVISNTEKMGLRKPPLVFTEQGVAALSGLLSLFEILGMINHPCFVIPLTYSYRNIQEKIFMPAEQDNFCE